MAKIELVIKIDEEDYKIMKHNITVNNPLCPLNQEEMVAIVANGIPLVKDHRDHITEKQKNYILDLIDHSDYPLDPINLKTATKKEASDWIKNNWKLAHERADKFGFY